MRIHLFAVALMAGAGLATSGHAASLISGLGGPAGYGELAMLPNDDQSSNQLNLPFTLNFFGNSYSQFYVNNNGNVTFNGPVSEYTPQPFPVSSQPMIAPYWADVDTRGAGAVYVGSPNSNTAVVTWNDVGYYNTRSDKTNDFQLVLTNRSETGAGNFDIDFRYNRLEWTTGDASGGSGGLGGTPAQAGYDAGDNVNFFALPGSFTNDVLDLVNTSNVSLNTPGLWHFTIRNGEITDGSTPETPLLPEIVDEDGWHFDFDIDLDEIIFIDPLVAVGYDYVVNSGPNIATALFPVIPGDVDGYEVYGFNIITNAYDVFLGTAFAGVTFDFTATDPLGVSRFGLRDIDVGLDPNDTLAFVTGLTFVAPGTVSMVQAPVTVNTDVPEPSSVGLLLSALLGSGLLWVRRCRV